MGSDNEWVWDFFWGSDKNIWNYIAAMVAQLCEYNENHLEGVNFIISEMYVNKTC